MLQTSLGPLSNGSKLAFFAHFEDATHIYVADAETGAARKLTTTPVLATLSVGSARVALHRSARALHRAALSRTPVPPARHPVLLVNPKSGDGKADRFWLVERCRERGIKHQLFLDIGLIANEICERSKVADIVIIGHRGINEEFSTGLLGTTAESITRKCPRPVFVSTKRFKVIERPVLAYDGSQRASSAMESAAEFCTVLGLPLTVLTVAKEEPMAKNILQQARSYLSSYAIDTRYEIDRGYPEQKIIDYLTKFDYDLLFIGAYGHRRIIEMVIGGTTEYVLRKSPCPVFLNR